MDGEGPTVYGEPPLSNLLSGTDIGNLIGAVKRVVNLH